MRTFAIAASVLAISIFSANIVRAQDSSAATPTPQATAVALPVPLQMAEKVCSGGFVLSNEAAIACQTKQYPRVIKAGDRFENRGIGAEFNTLIRQLGRKS